MYFNIIHYLSFFLFLLLLVLSKVTITARCWWFTPVILATWEVEIRRIVVQSQPRANSSRDPISKKLNIKKGWWSGSRCRP
jgi:hypothetical protein